MKILISSLILACIATSAPAAQPNDKFKLGHKETTTPVSGYPGAWVELGTDGKYQALHSIAWGEKTDDPCGLFVVPSHINRFSSALDNENMKDKSVVSKYVFGEFKIVDTNRHLYIDESGETQFAEYVKLDCGGDLKSVSTIANDKYVYKLNVCTTDKRKSSDNKLKGIRIWSRTLTYKDYKPGDAAILTDEPTAHAAYHAPHCDDWHKPTACGPGEVAARLRVHHNDSGHRDWITGLSLVCRKVEINETLERPIPTRAPARLP